MNESAEYDVIVIGAGPAGEVAAGRLADAGLDVAIVEQHLVAGECSFYACMPSKALLRPGELLEEAQRVPGVKEAVNGDLDVPAALARRDEIINDLDDADQVKWLERHGIELVRGTGGLDGERRVRVGDRLLTARQAVIISTGTGAATPPIEGIGQVSPWNNRQATTAKVLPASMIVLGGGPVGCELAEAWASFGTRITLVEPEAGLLAKEEPFAGEAVAASLEGRHGVKIILGALAEKVSRSGDRVNVHLSDGQNVQAEQLLLATGRKPMLEGLGLETIGLGPDGFIGTGDDLLVTGDNGPVEWLYAIGDVNGRVLLTHMGKYQAWVVSERILGRKASATSEALGPPRVTFTDPQIAAVGKTLAQAEEAGFDALAVDADTNSTAGASFTGKGVEGTSRLVIDRDRETIVGATFVGFETAEWLHAATIAIVGEVPMSKLRHAIPAFPTRSEIWLRLLEAYEKTAADSELDRG